MTNKVDNYNKRTAETGLGVESTEGVPKFGFADPTGEHPKRDYFYGSSISNAARGVTTPEISTGSEVGIDATVADQKPSQYPHNDVIETSSGHVWSIDDTPGGERILMKHRTGSGLELRADGSVLFASKSKRVSIIEGNDVLIIEGKADVVYKGDLNLRVSGNYNLEVGGNYNINVAGDQVSRVRGQHATIIDKNETKTVRGTKNTTVGGNITATAIGDYNTQVKGNASFRSVGNMQINSGNVLTTSGVNEWVASAKVASVTAKTISMIGSKGTIGGNGVDFFGKTFGGLGIPLGIPLPPGKKGLGVPTIATFHGTLQGRADEANRATVALDSWRSYYSAWAKECGFAARARNTPDPSKSTKDIPLQTKFAAAKVKAEIPPPTYMGQWQYFPVQQTKICPNFLITNSLLLSTTYGNHPVNVTLDEEQIRIRDKYKGAFSTIPTIYEIRSKLRDPQWRKTVAPILAKEGKISDTYKTTIPKKIGRTANGKSNVRFGQTPLGNNPNDSRSKRFTTP